jgi:3-polyprenyl-4-hydroxybenzoate decarboxylase
MALLDGAKQQSVHYRGLRDWLDKVQAMGELLCVHGADWDAEMGSITQMLTERSNNTAPAILFDEVPGYPKGFRTLYGHFSTIKRVALTLGLPLQHDRKVDIVQRYHQRMQNLKTLPRVSSKTVRFSKMCLRAMRSTFSNSRFRAIMKGTSRVTSVQPAA